MMIFLLSCLKKSRSGICDLLSVENCSFVPEHRIKDQQFRMTDCVQGLKHLHSTATSPDPFTFNNKAVFRIEIPANTKHTSYKPNSSRKW